MPLAAVTGRAELMDAVPAGGLGGTFAGNPLACAVALEAIERENLNRAHGRRDRGGPEALHRGSRLVKSAPARYC